MKDFFFLYVALAVLLTSCSSATDKSKTEPAPTKLTREALDDLREMVWNGSGELDAVSAKYNIGRDTIRDILSKYSGHEDSLLSGRGYFAERVNGKKIRPANIVTAELAEHYRLPFATVGNIIYDSKVLYSLGKMKMMNSLENIIAQIFILIMK